MFIIIIIVHCARSSVRESRLSYMDSKYSPAHREGRLRDTRIIDRAWRQERLPVVEIEVPLYELPLPEGVGEEKLQQENLSMREIEEAWKERLHECTTPRIRQPSQ